MALFLPTLTLLLIAAATIEVNGCVCYVGQEQDPATKRYGWSLAEQRPCECTEFRLGGVNMKPQMKPYEVMIGGSSVSINEQGQIIQSPDYTEDPSGTTFEGTSLCAQNTYRFQGLMALQLPMTSPMRLEFTVNTDAYVVDVCFSANGPGCLEALYGIELGADFGIFLKLSSLSQVHLIEVQVQSVNYLGVPVIMTYINGRFEVAVQGVPDSTLTYDVTSPPQPSWFVSFVTLTEAEIIFTEPCISDFNPQFLSD
ncbi:uncharacterized protein [Asterias amurensis]|uniref:uncharacterized protein n=1 Tax=Asterias amurensis TaxID=7602 RepID=UPI003AB73675